MTTASCPDRVALEGYVLGHVEDADIDAHLDECPACQSALDQMDAALNRPFAVLREPAPPSTFLYQTGYSTLVAHVKALTTTDVCPLHSLGNYQLLETIGEGGMGRVYKAMHQRLKKIVAVKVLAPSLVRSPEVRERFRQEMEAVGRLASPHIVAAFDAGEADGRDFLVMEYVEGEDLAQLVRRGGSLPIEQALNCIEQAARGLADAHAAGIVHRDVKPSNLLLDRAGVVKVLDLGLARILPTHANDTDASDSEPSIMGTAAYMAPEQALDTSTVDAAADIYSLGCTLFYLLTGRTPYEATTSMDMLQAHREEPIPSVRALRPAVPAPVARLVERMLAKQPSDRPASMQAVFAQLAELRSSRANPPQVRFDWRVAMAASIIIAVVGMAALAVMNPGGVPGSLPQEPAPGVTPKKDATPVIAMVQIPAGKFLMGAPDTDTHANSNEKPRREIKINRPFLMGKTEVTQDQYAEVMGTNPSAFSKNGQHKSRIKEMDTSKHPVESITWLDAVRFCNKLSERHELQPYYNINKDVVTIRGGTGYRLPTEAEWEYACRGNTSTTWYFGENSADLKEHAWIANNSEDRTHPVGQKKSNPFGLYDMYGNVPEWCWDRFSEDYYKEMPASDPPGAGTGRFRVYRGGAWNSILPRSSARVALGLTYGGEGSINIIGFRVARSVEP